ncbi:TonB-dependent receptor [Tenacibaculum ovolyticum]|uniref:TonB-dependent receptor n=1 Tax=Tenacibaculum ovolyticum TaxID=104270 RepID=UPI001F17DFF3|nr:TonB-dependent receptor [Tenacibaculum ovolyticum]
MKKLIIITLLSLCHFAFSQNKGTVSGTLTDKEMNGEALPFANVFIKGTSIGGTTDMDGKYSINVPVGTQTIVFSFIGYQTIEKQIDVKLNQPLIINQELGANEGVSLDEVEIKVTVSREKESALLLQQKKASVIVESIGAQELSKKGVSDAASATTKISGVAKSEGSGDIYIRGLGDRYLSTTMNGLPIPSDDVSNKNVNLSLFNTNIIQNVGISKTYSTSSYVDQGSGNVDIASKEYTRDMFSISINGGANTNALKVDNFKQSIISDDVTFGFHKKKYALQNLMTLQGWDTKNADKPINYGISLSGAKKFNFLNKDWKILTSISHSKSSEYRNGFFKAYRSNVLNNSFSDVENFITKTNSTGYIRVDLKLNENNKLKYNTLFVNKGEDRLYEQGRNGEGYVFDQDPQETGAFVRDQNFRQTTMIVNQLMGEHNWKENNKLNWAAAYNYVLAEEPNRIRNEVNILDINASPLIQFSHVGDFQQRKSSQKIEDIEYNAFIENQWALGSSIDEYEAKPYKLNYGLNYRKKERTFNSLFIGFRAKGFTAPSIDEISQTLQQGVNGGLTLRNPQADLYKGELSILAAYTNFDFKFNNKLSGNLGLRFERDEIDMSWNVANRPGRYGATNKVYENLYPSVNLKYELNENNFIRFASSVTQTLPEFKELSPFEYASPEGRIIVGNEFLEKSDIYNIDLKWEFFPSRSELFSATAFYKQINNPINLTQTQGSSGYFKFFNTGEQADILGFELESRLNLLKNEDDQTMLSATANITKMWFNQDLDAKRQYKGIKESELQGASDFIANGSLSYSNNKEHEFTTTLTGNYASDKIYALGSPEDFTNSATLYNDEIIEKGFITLDFVASKQLFKGFTVKLVGKNLLNPAINQTQLVRDLNTLIQTNETVKSYKKGRQLTLSLNYTF